MTGLIGGVIGFGLAFIALGVWQCATARRRLNRATDQAIALTRPPAPDLPRTGPAPGHQHGGIAGKIILFRCGCTHVLDDRGAITEVIPCWGTDGLDDELRRLLS